MRVVNSIKFAIVFAAGALISACATPTSYMGIDITAAAQEVNRTPERDRKEKMRNILMLIAMIDGCYERVDGGFKPVRAARAPNFECAVKLSRIEELSKELGLGFLPSGIQSVSLVSLARSAQAGDKRAQLELGVRFEEGIGVEKDLKKARSLYARAAATTGGTIWIYQPPVGNGTTGQVVPYDTGPRQPGLRQAKERLAALEEAKGS